MRSSGFLLIELMLSIGFFVIFVMIISGAQAQIALRRSEAGSYYQAVSYLSSAIDDMRTKGVNSAPLTIKREGYTITLKRVPSRRLQVKDQIISLAENTPYIFIEASVSWSVNQGERTVVFNTGMVMQ